MSKKFQNGKIITISLSHLVHDTYTAFLAPLLPLLIAKLGLTLSLAGTLDIIRKIPALSNPFIGLLADKICLKYIVILTPAVSAVSMSLLGVAPSYPVLFILLLVTGISSTLYHIPAPVMIKNFAGDKTGTGMSFFMFGGEMARTLGPLLITWALSVWGLEGSWRVMPLGLLASLILYFKLRDVSALNRNGNTKPKIHVWHTLKELAPLFVFIFGFQLFRAGMKSALTLYLPTYLVASGKSLWFAGVSLSVLQFAGAAGTFGAGWVSDKITHRNALLITAFFSPLVMGALLFANDWMKLPLLILMGILLFASGPILLALVQETNTARPAFVNSIYMTINFSISSLMVLAVGLSGDLLGLEMTFRVSALLAIMAVPFVFILPKKGK